MSDHVRFISSIDAEWRVQFTCEQDPAWQLEGSLADHELVKVAAPDDGYYPHPPLALHEPDTDHGKLTSPAEIGDVCRLYRVILAREQDPSGIKIFGHYLFDALLGPVRWAQIAQTAESMGAKTVELALCFPTGETNLDRLNWELMCSDAGFLAAGTGKLRVAITRLVKAAGKNAGESPAPLSTPPRALFVVGTSLNEDQIRPGAELHGLLKNACGGRVMRSRVLQRASPSEVKEAVRTFEPDIVHFICHGGVDRERGFYLDLQTDEPDADPERFAEQLLLDLDRDGVYPTIVVLSACTTGGAPLAVGGHIAAPLATKLVSGGIPIVIGMAGRVADITCRVFARRFGQAVVNGEPLVQATAVARQVAFVEGRDPVTTPDWAFPAVFIADNVRSDYTPVEPAGDADMWAKVEHWISRSGVRRKPVFCGREDYVRTFHHMFESSGGSGAERKRVLALFSDSRKPRYGRSRLLEEFAAQAFREGHLPVMLTFRKTPEPPRDLEDLANSFALAILRTRTEVLALGPAASSQLDAIFDGRSAIDLAPVLRTRAMWGAGGELTPSVVAHAIRRDLATLLADARARYDFFEHGQMAVLLDNVDELEQTLVDLLFASDGGLLNSDGLGIADMEPVPVVMTCSLGGNADGTLGPIHEGRNRPSWLDVRLLGPFADDGEDMLAYELVLLHPVDTAGEARIKDVSNVPWAFNDSIEDKVRTKWQSFYRDRLQGIPGKFDDADLYELANYSSVSEFTIKADDEVWLAKLGH